MNIHDVRLAKKKIIKCLTEDFTYGKTKDSKPPKRPRKNLAIFDKKDGYAIFDGVDLEMVVDKVMLGLYLAMADSMAEDVTQ